MTPWTTRVLVSLLLWALGSLPAWAAHIPPDCSTGDIALGLHKSTSDIANGDTVIFTVTLDNGPAPACTASNLTIQGFCPDAGGVPNTFPNVVFPVIPTLAVATPEFVVGTFSCVVTVNDGVTVASARNVLSGTLNDLDGIDDPLNRTNQVSVTLVAAPPVAPPPSAVPTLSEWAMIALVVFLALAAGARLHRTRAI